MDELDEIWKDIEDWPFHQVSNKGRVRVLPGGKVKSRVVTEIELRKLTPHRGYMTISQGLLDKRGSYNRSHAVHTLMLNAFIGPRPGGQECRHLNGNKSDNRWPENIKWGTKEKNERDKVRHGTDPRGERNPNSKLKESDIIDIRTRPNSSGLVKQLVTQYNVHYETIRRIRTGQRWKHIDEFEYKKKLSMKPMHLIPDMKPVEFPQMMLSFGG